MLKSGSLGRLWRILLGRRPERQKGRPKKLSRHRPAAAMEVAEELRPPQPRTPQQAGPALPPEPELPWSYGETRITALARDPYWLYVYWDLSEVKREEVRARFGDGAWEAAQPVLRVYDTTGVSFYDSHPAQEIRINDYASDWYIPTGEPGHTFCVELGRLLPGGIYIFLARSNPVSMPRDRVSEVVDYQWLLPVEYEKLIYGRTGAPSSPEFIKGLQLAREQEGYLSSPLQWPPEPQP